jgi:hypothetical protein
VDLLADKARWKPETVMDVRLGLAYTVPLLEKKILPKSRRERVGRVFHLNHAEHLELRSVEEIAGAEWLHG